MDMTRPVVVTSTETVSNVVTVPADSGDDLSGIESSFNTNTYFQTYLFTKGSGDSITTSKEVVTQIVVTEAPRIKIQPTAVNLNEVTKTYLNTVTFTTTAVEGTETVVRKTTSVVSETVTETVKDLVEPTPVIEGSMTDAAEDVDLPIVATKTYFTTSTYYTTLLEGTKTIVNSRKEVTTSLALVTIPGFDFKLLASSLFSSSTLQTVDTRPTFVKLGPSLYGKLKTVFNTATYFITNLAGDVSTKNLVVPQVSTITVSLSKLPEGAVIDPTAPVPSIEATSVPQSSLLLNADKLSSLKQSFLSGSQAPSTPLIPGTEDAKPTATPDVDSSLSSTTTKPSDTVPGSVILVTDSNGNVHMIPTHVLNGINPTSTVQGTLSSSTISSGSSSSTNPSTSTSTTHGGISTGIGALLGGLGTFGLTMLSQNLKGNNHGGLNINLGPMFDAMTGVLSNGFIHRRNDTDRNNPSSIDRNQILSPPPPPREPLFIPIHGLAGEAVNTGDGRTPQHRPPNQSFIPLRQPADDTRPVSIERQPTVIRRPAPGNPLFGQPGTPFFVPGPLPGRPTQISPSLQTGFTGIPNLPQSIPSITRLPTVTDRPLPPPPAFVNGINVEGIQIQPTRLEVQQGQNTQFFAANGQAINVPPLPIAAVPPPAPAPGQPQQPVEAFNPGVIAPGPDGKLVKIIGVPEGQRPPPGAQGQVFIHPVPEVPIAVVQGNKVQFTPTLPDDLRASLSTDRPKQPQFQVGSVLNSWDLFR